MTPQQQRLKELFIESYEKGYLTEDFAQEALSLAAFIISKSDIPRHEHEDVLANFSLKLVKSWGNIDPEKFSHNYIAIMAVTQVTNAKRRFEKQLKDREHYDILQPKPIKRSKTIAEELKVKKASYTREQRRILRRCVITLWRNGYPKKQIAAIVGINRKTVQVWINTCGNSRNAVFYTKDNRSKNGRRQTK